MSLGAGDTVFHQGDSGGPLLVGGDLVGIASGFGTTPTPSGSIFDAIYVSRWGAISTHFEEIAASISSNDDLIGEAGKNKVTFDYSQSATPFSQVLTGYNANEYVSGAGGNDTIYGMGGDDTLDGGSGNDYLVGGTGNDHYIIDSAKDVVSELAGEGIDTVSTVLASYSLGSSVENLIYTGNGAFKGTGNTLDNSITGGAGRDTLAGGVGNDTLTGGTGADSLVGGEGSDVFVFTTGDSGRATGFDTVSAFTKGAVGSGDLVDFSASLRVGGSAATASADEASVNQSTGVVTFAAKSGASMADALSDVAARFTASTDTLGEFALFRVGNKGNFFLFISDGSAGVTSNDVVVQLTGITSIGAIDLTGGNLSIV